MKLAHQLRLSLGQAAGLGQFVDAGAHPDQSCCLGKRQAGRVALFQLRQFVRQRRNDRPQFMQVFAHAHVAVLVVVNAFAQVLDALVALRIALGLLRGDLLLGCLLYTSDAADE